MTWPKMLCARLVLVACTEQLPEAGSPVAATHQLTGRARKPTVGPALQRSER